MLKLDTTLKSLQVLLAGAVATNQLPIVVSYVEIDQTTFEVLTMAEADFATTGATPVTVVTAPASGKTRKIDFLSIVNVDTAPVIVTIRVNNNAILRPVITVELAVGDNLNYVG